MFLLFIIIFVVVVYSAWRSYYDKSNYVKDEDFSIYYEIPEEDEEPELAAETKDEAELETEEFETDGELETEGEIETEEETDEDLEALESEIAEAVKNHELESAKYVYNILLIGSDRRDGSWYGNSDTMILVSVNTKTKKLHLTSFMRDLYATIPGIGVKKLNAAYAHGAGPLLVKTIEDNFRIDINNWASVDFGSMETIINSLGGVNLELYQAEADYVNAGCKGEPQLSAGMMHLNGKQAVAFARIRYVGRYDYERTSRQRRVLEQLVGNMRGLSISQLNQFVNNVLPLITHNVSELELASKLTSLPEWINYQVVQDRIPYDGLYGHQGEMLVPYYDETITRLKQTIYATE